MAQNVTIAGASYTDVTAIEVPKTTSGVASFHDVTDTTATAGDVLSGKSFYNASGVKTSGSIATKSSSDLTASGATVTVPAGYYASSASKSVASGSATTPATTITSNPSISVSSSGLITASNSKTQSVTPTVSAGYVSSGTAGTITVNGSNTQQLTTKAAATYTPGTTNQTIASGQYLTGAQTIAGDANLVPANIASGVSIFGVTGSHSGGQPEESDVNFCDYDGTLVKSYTAADFANVTAMPANPTHAGLTAQGWNWSLSDAKSYVADFGGLVIGQSYITSDGKTRLYINISDTNLLSFGLYITVSNGGSFTIDWGDNSSANTVNSTTVTYHQYSTIGDYIITLNVTSGTISLRGNYNTGSYAYTNGIIRWPSEMNISGHMGFYRAIFSILKHVEIGANTVIEQNAFRGFLCLETVSVPIGGLSNSATFEFNEAEALKGFVVPSGVTTLGEAAFKTNYTLKYISLPDSITNMGIQTMSTVTNLRVANFPRNLTTIPARTYESCNNLTKITAYNNVTSILDNAFYNCRKIDSFILSRNLTTLGTYVFSNCYRLANVYLGESLTILQSYAFNNCYSLASLTIPETVTTIQSNAITACYCLLEVHFKSQTPPTLSASNAFYNISPKCKFYVPTGSLSAYTGATNYPSSSTYTYIEE